MRVTVHYTASGLPYLKFKDRRGGVGRAPVCSVLCALKRLVRAVASWLDCNPA